MYNAMLLCLPRPRLTREANATTLLSRHLYDFDFHATQVRGHWALHYMETSLASSGPEDRAAARVDSLAISPSSRSSHMCKLVGPHERHNLSAAYRDRTSW